MKQKGFTLVELLVVMVILGIITAISIPLVRNIRQSNIQKEYQTYMNSVKYGAKLYVDSYGEDLFGNNETGCAVISYHDLKEKNLIKDFDKDGMSCDSDDTYVRVVKLNKKYGYSVSIGCGKKADDGAVHVTYKNPKGGIDSIETCGIDADVIMSFSTDITNPNSFKYKKRSMKVIVSSNTGIARNPLIQFAFSEVKDGATVSSWNNLTIQPEAKEKQDEKILQGMTITATSSQISTPEGLTGKYYLILRVDRLQNSNNLDWAVEGTDRYVYLGPFTLDNTKPEFNNSSIISSNTSYHALKPKLSLKVTDSISAPNEEKAKERLKMCVSFSTDSCGKNKTSFANYESYDPSKVLDKIKESLDGSKNKVFVTVVDPANNYRTKEFSYELASVITYNGNGNTGGSTSQTICNNNTDCTLRTNGFERTGYNFEDWYSAASGGIKYESTVQLSGNLNVYAHWKAISYKIQYNLDGGTATNPITYTIDTPTFTLNNPTKDGYLFTGWTGSNGTKKQKTVKVTQGSMGNKSFTANWELDQREWKFDYTGDVQFLKIDRTGNYKLQVWGAQGGGYSLDVGGFGGYAEGVISLNKNEIIYIVVGGSGAKFAGGYNGGGAGAWGQGGTCGKACEPQWGYGGGGATHIATVSGVLSSLYNNTDSVLIVAGGGGGNGGGHGDYPGNDDCQNVEGGNGGGENGENGANYVHPHVAHSFVGNGATSSGGGNTLESSACATGSFGQGASYCNTGYGGCGGGGGWYGGGGSSRGHAGGGGGSGHIGSRVSNGSMSNGQRKGNGYAIVTFLP